MTPYYLIDDHCNESKFQKWVADQIENDPSNYSSHDTHTYWLNGKDWKLTTFEMRELPLIDDNSAIEKARQAEGTMDLGQGPNLDDGKIRVLYSTLRFKQLLMEPCPDKYENTAVWEMKCLHTVDERVPLEFGVKKPKDGYVLWLEPYGEDSEPVFLKVAAEYHTPNEFRSSSNANVVSAGASLSTFLNVRLKQSNAFLCRCQGTVSITNVVVKLHETTRCIVPHNGGFGIQEDTRSATLKDTKITDCCLDHSTFTSKGASFFKYMAVDQYKCNLPNLGPTFHSQNCSRTYTLEIQVSFSCNSEKSCSLTSALKIDLDVALKDHNTDLKALEQVQKRQDYLSVKVLKLSSNIMNDVAGIMARQLQSMESWCLGYHACTIAMGEYALVVTTIFLPDKLKKQHFNITWPCKQVAFSNEPRLVLINGTWRFEGPIQGNIDQLILSPFLAISRATKLGCGISLRDYWLSCTRVPGRRAVPGEDLCNLIEVYVNGNRYTDCITVKTIKVDLIQHTTQRTADGSQAQKKKSINLCTKYINIWRVLQWKLYLDKTLGKFWRLDNNLLDCKIPDVPPSLLSSSVHRTYSVKIRILFYGLRPDKYNLTRYVELPINQKEK